MSRSNPPRSTIVEKVRNDSALADPAGQSGRGWFPRTVSIRIAALMRWLHIYLSMFGLAAVLLFSVTGITLNHPDWFSEAAERSVQYQGKMRFDWIRRATTDRGEETGDDESSDQVNKLEIVEFLRRTHGVRGALTDFRVDQSECSVTFKGPGYSADAFIDRETGQYQLTESAYGLVAILNDLHKGRDTGVVWSVLIDVVAVLMALISLTGLVLLFTLKRRRILGLVVSVIGTLVLLAVIYWCVP